MKKTARNVCISLAALLIVCLGTIILFADSVGSGQRDAAWYAEYVKQNEDALIQIALGELNPEESFLCKRLLARGAVEQVYMGEGRSCFYVKKDMVEGHVCLVYAPEGNVPTCLGFYDNWVFEERENGISKWTGGMAGKAYILLHDLGNGFYLEEAYLPT